MTADALLEHARAFVADLSKRHPEQHGRFVVVELESWRWWSGKTDVAAMRRAKAAGAGRCYLGCLGSAAAYQARSPRPA